MTANTGRDEQGDGETKARKQLRQTHMAGAGRRSRGAGPLTAADRDTMILPHSTYLKSTSVQQAVHHGSTPLGDR